MFSSVDSKHILNGMSVLCLIMELIVASVVVPSGVVVLLLFCLFFVVAHIDYVTVCLVLVLLSGN